MQDPFKSQSTFARAIPTVVVNDIDLSLAFFQQLGFHIRYQETGFAIATRDAIAVYFTSREDQRPEDNWSGCNIVVTNIEALYQEAQATHAIHPRGHLETKWWGDKQFSLIDPCGVLITFTEPKSGT